MPRARASKSDTHTSLEKLEDLSPMHHMILFDYCDGFKSNGMVGFNVVNTAGSTKHWSSMNVYKTFLRKSQFCSKGEKVALLAKDLVNSPTDLNHLRPNVDAEFIELLQKDQESNTPSQNKRLQQLVTSEDAIEIFIFDQNYIGIKSKGEKGFSPGAGPPGSINHTCSFRIFQQMSESKFCERDRELAKLAQEFVDANDEPVIPSITLENFALSNSMFEAAAGANW